MRILLVSVALLLGCSDDIAPKPDLRADGPTGDGRVLDVRPIDGKPVDVRPIDGKPADGKPAPEGGAPDATLAVTACGPTLKCNTASQICLVSQAHLKEYACQPVPAGCETQRTCACLGKALCTGIFNFCVDGTAGSSNTITCECPAC